MRGTKAALLKNAAECLHSLETSASPRNQAATSHGNEALDLTVRSDMSVRQSAHAHLKSVCMLSTVIVIEQNFSDQSDKLELVLALDGNETKEWHDHRT
jgi:hypothetical protein